jgi:hypothetical protein
LQKNIKILREQATMYEICKKGVKRYIMADTKGFLAHLFLPPLNNFDIMLLIRKALLLRAQKVVSRTLHMASGFLDYRAIGTSSKVPSTIIVKKFYLNLVDKSITILLVKKKLILLPNIHSKKQNTQG